MNCFSSFRRFGSVSPVKRTMTRPFQESYWLSWPMSLWSFAVESRLCFSSLMTFPPPLRPDGRLALPRAWAPLRDQVDDGADVVPELELQLVQQPHVSSSVLVPGARALRPSGRPPARHSIRLHSTFERTAGGAAEASRARAADRETGGGQVG